MKVICPGCRKEYEVEDHRIPPKGLRMRCTECRATIAVEGPGAKAPAAFPAAPPGPGPAVRSAVPTIQGIAPPPREADPFGDLPAPKPPASDPFGDLPARKSAPADLLGDLPAPRPAASDPFGDLPARKPAPADPFGGVPGPRPPKADPFTDLPGPKVGIADPFANLPVPRAGAAAFPAPADPFADLSPARPARAAVGHAPTLRAPGMTALPAPKGDPFGGIDLPAPHVRGATDLPAPRGDPFAGMDLPMPQAPGLTDLPVHRDDPFAGLDLPVGREPSVPPAVTAGIPIPRAAGADDPLQLASMPPHAGAAPPIPAPAPPKVTLPATAASHAPAPTPAPAASAPEPAPRAKPHQEKKGGTAFGELDLGEMEPTAMDTAAALPEGYRSAGAGGEAALDLGAAGPARPAPSSTAARQAAEAAGKPAARRMPLAGGLLLLVAAAGVPWALGHGPFGLDAILGGDDSAGAAAARRAHAVADAAVETAPRVAVAGAETDERLWGDLPRVDGRFLARPDVLVDGVSFDDYIRSGEALLTLQDSLYMTRERFGRLSAIPAFNDLVPMQPRPALLRLRVLAGLAFARAGDIATVNVRTLSGMGRVYLLDGDVSRALAAFDKALGLDPENVDLLFHQARATLAQRTADRFQRAERVLVLLDGLAPGDPRLLVMWGDVNLGYEAYGKADEQYRAAVDAVRAAAASGTAAGAPDAETAAEAGEAGDAGDEAGGGPAADPAVVETAYRRAIEFLVLVAGKKKSGEIPALSHDVPEPPEAYLAEAAALYAEGRSRLAVPLPLDAAYGVAVTKYALGHKDAALLATAKTVLETARAEAAEFLVPPLDPMFYLGVIYFHDRQVAEARDVFERIQAQDETYPGVFMMLVQLSFSPQLLREQLPDNLRRLDRDPANPELLLRAAVSAYYAGRQDLAIEKLRAILAQDAYSPDANHYLGRIFLERGELGEAKRYLLTAIERTATPVASYYLYLGWVYEKEGSYNDAIRNLRLAKDLDNTSWEAFWRLGEVYAHLRVQDATDTSLGLLETAARLNPRAAAVQASLGRYQEAAGAAQSAIEHYRSALRLSDASGELGRADLAAIRTSLGKLLDESDPGEALSHFRRAVRIGIELEDAARTAARKPDLLLPARWYWEAAYRAGGIHRDRRDLQAAAAYYRWVLPYVQGKPEEATARRALGVIMQMVPASEIPEPDSMRTMTDLP